MDNKKIGLFLKKLREEKKISQQDLANAIFVDRTLVNKWENGKTCLTSQNLKVLSDYYNVSADELLAGEYINEDNSDYVENIKYSLLDQNIRIIKIIKYLLLVIVCFIILFLTCYFIFFYKSVFLYGIKVDSEKLKISSGILLKTNETIIMNLKPEYYNIDVKELRLYYLYNNEKHYFLKTNNTSDVFFNDSINEQEYFDFSIFKEIINDMYIELIDNEDNQLEYKLLIINYYNNNKIFVNKNKRIEYNTAGNNINNNEKLIDVDIYQKDIYEIDYNSIHYLIAIHEDVLLIYYTINSDNYSIMYFIPANGIFKKINDLEVYSVVINREDINNDSIEYIRDYKLIRELLKEII